MCRHKRCRLSSVSNEEGGRTSKWHTTSSALECRRSQYYGITGPWCRHPAPRPPLAWSDLDRWTSHAGNTRMRRRPLGRLLLDTPAWSDGSDPALYKAHKQKRLIIIWLRTYLMNSYVHHHEVDERWAEEHSTRTYGWYFARALSHSDDFSKPQADLTKMPFTAPLHRTVKWEIPVFHLAQLTGSRQKLYAILLPSLHFSRDWVLATYFVCFS